MPEVRLAIDGGDPVRSAMLSYGHQTIERADLDAVEAALASDWLTTGPMVDRFEADFAAKVTAPYAVAVSSGTAALHAAAFAAGIGPGDEVIVPALTFAASANCVLYQGGSVVFADVRNDTLTLDADSVEDRLTQRTRAIITVDYAGQPADIAELKSLASAHGLLLIEDASHSLGAMYRGSPVGSLADFTTFSFHPVKLITTGEGGMVTTASPGGARSMRHFRNHGITTDARQREAFGSWRYEMEFLGNNYRLTDFQCALGLQQIGRLDRFLNRRKEIAAIYDRELCSMAEIELPKVLPDRTSAWHLYVIRLNLGLVRESRRRVFDALRAENIGVNVHYIPVPWHPFYRRLGFAAGQWPVAEGEYERLLTLPLWPGMSDGDAESVVEALKKVVGAYRA